MTTLKTVKHSKGQKHPSKTKWGKVINKSTPPIIDEDNPELANDPKVKFIKSKKEKANN